MNINEDISTYQNVYGTTYHWRRGGYIPGVFPLVRYPNQEWTDNQVFYGTGLKTHFIKIKNSINTPGFYRLKPSERPLNPYTYGWSKTFYDSSVLSWSFISDDVKDIATYTGPASHFGANVEVEYPIFDDSAQKAINKLLDGISPSSGSLAVTLAEVPKTVDMIAKTVEKLVNAFRALRRGRPREFAAVLKLPLTPRQLKRLEQKSRKSYRSDRHYRTFAANTWLEYTYGWLPLISDIHAQAKNLQTYLNEEGGGIRVGRASSKTHRKVTVRSDGPGFPCEVTTRHDITLGASFMVRYGLKGGPDFLTTFGIMNPALVAWELVPFSFVVDWFLPVGNFLQSLTATDGLVFLGGTEAHTNARTITSRWRATAAPYSGSGEGLLTKFVYQRTLLSSFPIARLPVLKDPSSWSHLASTMALFHTVFKTAH